MKFLILVLVCALTQGMPVKAQELNSTVSSGDVVVNELAKVNIPDVIGMAETDAVVALAAVTLPDGSSIEVIKTYEYSAETAADVILSQTLVGEVSAEEAMKVTIAISMGPEPAESLKDATQGSNGKTGSFGIADDIAPEISQGAYQLLDWDSLPSSYEFNWDNSANCWYNGCWLDVDEDGDVDVKYITPEGTYDNNVRHRIQLYCDGEYVYLHIKIATIYGAKFNGENYNFNIDGHKATFAVVKDGEVITGNVSGMENGTQQVDVIHGGGAISTTIVPGAEAYFTKYENNFNAEVELKIPLSEMSRQNESIDAENVSEISFHTSNLTTGEVTAAGASTFPLMSAAAALVLIPGSTILIKKKLGKKNEKEADEQSI